MVDTFRGISVDSLFENHGEKLELRWIAGNTGANRIIRPEEPLGDPQTSIGENLQADIENSQHQQAHPARKSLAGNLNLIHPHQIQIIGDIELEFLNGLRELTLHDTYKQLITNDPACIIIADNHEPPALLALRCNEAGIPLFTSSLPGNRLANLLRYYLASLFADTTILHGVFMEVMGTGVLITGHSGIGKSELALELITRGHRLVADDAPKFSRIAPDIVNGTCPEILRDFLEVRGLGIINVRNLYGDSSIKNEKYLRLIIRLEPMQQSELLKLDRLDGSYRKLKVLDVDIPEVTLPVAPGRNLAILLECAVQNHALRMRGYNASGDFITKQQSLIDQKSG